MQNTFEGKQAGKEQGSYYAKEIRIEAKDPEKSPENPRSVVTKPCYGQIIPVDVNFHTSRQS